MSFSDPFSHAPLFAYGEEKNHLKSTFAKVCFRGYDTSKSPMIIGFWEKSLFLRVTEHMNMLETLSGSRGK